MLTGKTTKVAKMKNKAVLSFVAGNYANVKYGKWISVHGKLYFNWVLIAESEHGKIICHEQRLQDCAFEYNTYHAISKVVKYLKRLK